MNNISPVDILAIAAHPDDVELGCAGTLIKSVAQGKKVGICDLTQGELGTRGSGKLRLEEAEEARKIIGADFRVNLKMADGFFMDNEENKLAIIRVIRACKPRVVLLNAPADRHPDHGRAANIQKVACFLSGLRKIETTLDGQSQEAYRPELMLHYIQDRYLEPSFIIDISDTWELKMKSIMAFGSQFYNPESKEPDSAISSKEFLNVQAGRGMQLGRIIGVDYGEGFISDRPIGIQSFSEIF